MTLYRLRRLPIWLLLAAAKRFPCVCVCVVSHRLPFGIITAASQPTKLHIQINRFNFIFSIFWICENRYVHKHSLLLKCCFYLFAFTACTAHGREEAKWLFASWMANASTEYFVCVAWIFHWMAFTPCVLCKLMLGEDSLSIFLYLFVCRRLCVMQIMQWRHIWTHRIHVDGTSSQGRTQMKSFHKFVVTLSAVEPFNLF